MKCGKHLGSAHRFVIYNGLSQWPISDALKRWSPKGSASTIDYLMGETSRSLLTMHWWVFVYIAIFVLLKIYIAILYNHV